MKQYTSEILPYDIGKINYTVRILLHLTEEVDSAYLEKAVQKAMTRYPYFSKQLIRQGEEYLIVDNKRPVAVYENKGETRTLNSAGVNFHMVSVDYSGNTLGFNASHILAGGCGLFEWIKTVLYCYLSECYSVELKVENIKLPGEDFVAGERDFLDINNLPEVETIGMDKIPNGEMPMGEYMLAFTNPEKAYNGYYRFEFLQKDLMSKAKSSDASPATLLSALMFRMLYKAWPDKKLPITGQLAHNYRSEVGCPNSTCDIVRQIRIPYPDKLADAPLEKLCTISRGSVIIQSQPENAINDGRKVLKRMAEVDKLKTLEEKVAYCQNHRILASEKTHSYNVSYTGQTQWGDMSQYIESGEIITDGHIMLEVMSMDDKFYVTFQQVLKDTPYVDGFRKELEAENIPYKVTGPFPKNLPLFEMPVNVE